MTRSGIGPTPGPECRPKDIGLSSAEVGDNRPECEAFYPRLAQVGTHWREKGHSGHPAWRLDSERGFDSLRFLAEGGGGQFLQRVVLGQQVSFHVPIGLYRTERFVFGIASADMLHFDDLNHFRPDVVAHWPAPG